MIPLNFFGYMQNPLQIHKVLASDVVLRAQERVLGFCDAKI
jgi:hypothetical protein